MNGQIDDICGYSGPRNGENDLRLWSRGPIANVVLLQSQVNRLLQSWNGSPSTQESYYGWYNLYLCALRTRSLHLER